MKHHSDKMLKAFLITLMVLGGLCSFFYSFLIVAGGVGGSGCGPACLEGVDAAKMVGLGFFGLALVLYAVPGKGRREDKKDEGK